MIGTTRESSSLPDPAEESNRHPGGRRRSPAKRPGLTDEEIKVISEKHFQDLVDKASTVLGCHDLACDAAQDALLALWKTQERPERPLVWLLQAVFLRSQHAERCRRRRKAYEDRFATAFREECVIDAAEPLAASESSESILKAAEQLPTEFRETFLLHARGLEYRAIADALHISIGTVRSRLSRARDRLQQLLSSQDSGAVAPFSDARRASQDLLPPAERESRIARTTVPAISAREDPPRRPAHGPHRGSKTAAAAAHLFRTIGDDELLAVVELLLRAERTLPDLASETGRDSVALARQLRVLMKNGLVRRHGHGRATVYCVEEWAAEIVGTVFARVAGRPS